MESKWVLDIQDENKTFRSNYSLPSERSIIEISGGWLTSTIRGTGGKR